MPNDNKPLILVFQGNCRSTNQNALKGISRYAQEVGWLIQTVEYDCTEKSPSFRSPRHERMNVQKLMEFWNPKGCIVECAGRAPRFRLDDFGTVATVFLDRPPTTMEAGALCVHSDSRSIANVAAKELLSLGFSHYAYLPHPQRLVWSVERAEAFRSVVQMNGKTFHSLDTKFKLTDPVDSCGVLVKWLGTVPKPCGVFAANDLLAERLAGACVVSGIPVPDQIAIVGVDDDDQICEHSPVSISSVQTDNEGAGRLAAELLHSCMRNPKTETVCSTFAAVGLHRRTSTRYFRKVDSRVVKALEYIRLNACSGIGPSDVFTVMRCSRSLANLRFREVTGHTVLDEIHAVRLEKVKALLRKRCAISSIPDQAGYASLVDMRRVFKNRTGLSMKQYRQQVLA